MSFNKAVISGLSIGIILISIKILSGSSVYALIAASLLALAISVQTGHSLKSNISDAFNVIKNCFPALLILMLTAAMTALWKAGGTFSTSLNYLLKLCSPKFIVPLIFIICGSMAWITGSSNSTILSIGVILYSIGCGFGISGSLLVGAIASGSLLGNVCSPVSDAVSLISSICELPSARIRYFIRKYVIVSAAASMIIFYISNILLCKTGTNDETISTLNMLLSSCFSNTIICLIPITVLILTAILHLPTIKSLILCIFISLITAHFTQDIAISDLLYTGIFGFDGSSLPEEVSSILKGSGILSLKQMLLIIILSSILGGFLSSAGIITSLIRGFADSNKAIGAPFVFFIVSLLILFISGNQLLPLISLGIEWKTSFKDRLSDRDFTIALMSSSIVGCIFIP